MFNCNSSAVIATDSAAVFDVFLAAGCVCISDAEVAVVLVVVGSAKESAFCRLRLMRFKYQRCCDLSKYRRFILESAHDL